jgi:hypothetical protein
MKEMASEADPKEEDGFVFVNGRAYAATIDEVWAVLEAVIPAIEDGDLRTLLRNFAQGVTVGQSLSDAERALRDQRYEEPRANDRGEMAARMRRTDPVYRAREERRKAEGVRDVREVVQPPPIEQPSLFAGQALHRSRIRARSRTEE